MKTSINVTKTISTIANMISIAMISDYTKPAYDTMGYENNEKGSNLLS